MPPRPNGFEGLDTELEINSPPFVKQIQRLLDMAKEGMFKYAGRDNAPDPLFVSGEAAISFNSSGSRGDIVKNAKFHWAEAFLPYDPEIITKPINSIIGGASLWTMTAPNRTRGRIQGRRAIPEVPSAAGAATRSGARPPAMSR